MDKTLDMKLTSSEAARIEAAIVKCDEALHWVFKQMQRDQAQIKKLKTETRAMLADMKNA